MNENWAFEMLALVYPHEAHELEPDKFWQLFQRWRPGVSHELMLKILDEIRNEDEIERAPK